MPSTLSHLLFISLETITHFVYPICAVFCLYAISLIIRVHSNCSQHYLMEQDDGSIGHPFKGVPYWCFLDDAREPGPASMKVKTAKINVEQSVHKVPVGVKKYLISKSMVPLEHTTIRGGSRCSVARGVTLETTQRCSGPVQTPSESGSCQELLTPSPATTPL